MEVSSFSRVSLVWKLFTRSGLKRLRVVVTKKKKKKETKGGGKFYALRHMRRNSSRDPPKSTHPIVYEKLNQHVDDEYEKLNFSRDGFDEWIKTTDFTSCSLTG
ncbi:hypothetical protein HID58_044201 [Brassica napus]|uniref:Uncharacterized protein n=1 Tax=Brassica napus TaxID=3708 RepID=A0ABQ8BJ28_BRANA|nr:hypothetical protein HID58_044201 [Brassica napus]